MKKIIIIALAIGIATAGQSQTQFIAKGKIEFERKINVHRQFEDEEQDSWLKEYLSKIPKFNTSLSLIHI